MTTEITTSPERVAVSPDFDTLLEQAASGHINAPVRVWGYWSSNPITVYCRRSFSASSYIWQVNISHSSGGRDTTEVESDVEAVKNFAEGLHWAASVAQCLMMHADELEARFQARRAADRAEFEARTADLKARAEADAPLGAANARVIIAQVRASEARGRKFINTYERGAEGCTTLTVYADKSSVFTWFHKGLRVSEAKALEVLAALSHRTHFAG